MVFLLIFKALHDLTPVCLVLILANLNIYQLIDKFAVCFLSLGLCLYSSLLLYHTTSQPEQIPWHLFVERIGVNQFPDGETEVQVGRGRSVAEARCKANFPSYRQ